MKYFKIKPIIQKQERYCIRCNKLIDSSKNIKTIYCSKRCKLIAYWQRQGRNYGIKEVRKCKNPICFRNIPLNLSQQAKYCSGRCRTLYCLLKQDKIRIIYKFKKKVNRY